MKPLSFVYVLRSRIFTFLALTETLTVIEQGTIGLLAVLVVVLSSLAAVVYVWRIVERAYFGTPVDASATRREAPPALLLGLWLVAIANIYFGLAPQLQVTLAETAATNLLGLSPQ